MLKQILAGYQPVIVGAFVLDFLLAVKHVASSFGLVINADQTDALTSLVALVIAFVVKDFTISRKFVRDGA